MNSFNTKILKRLTFIIFILSFSTIAVNAQLSDTSAIVSGNQGKHIIKFRLLSSIEMFQNYNRQIIGLEYEHKLKEHTSWVLDFDIGYFDNYIYYQYFDFFTTASELPYTRQDVVTKGFHIIPEYRYYYYSLSNVSNDGFYIAGATDFHYYKKNFSQYDSRTQQYQFNTYSTFQSAIGGELGLQFIFKKRIAFDFSICGFYGLWSVNSDEEKHIPSKNASWNSDNEAFWVNYQLKLGYIFGK